MSMTSGQCAAWLALTPSTPHQEDTALLDADELDTNHRLASPALRARHARAHALLRSALSQVAGGRPGDWCFKRDAKGRPYLDAAGPGLDFNLSHSGRLVACAIVRDARVGIDVESIRPGLDFKPLLNHVASPLEREWLEELSEPEARRDFYRMWVLKEAYAKAVGAGLGLPFAEITLMPWRSDAARCDLSAIDDHHAAWLFRQWAVGHEAVLAVAIRDESAAPVRFEIEWMEGGELLREQN